MTREVYLSKRARMRLEKILDYLNAEWSPKVKDRFIKKLDKTLEIISKSPDVFPKSNLKNGLYK